MSKLIVEQTVGESVYLILDNGHTKICPICESRYDEDKTLSGHSRELEVELCKSCYSKKLKYQASKRVDWK
jgi:hypothetical protein